MGNHGDEMRDLLSKLAVWVGMKQSRPAQLQELNETLLAAKQQNLRRLEELKARMRQLESAALRKSQELKTAKGAIKPVIGREIERLFREVDRHHGEEQVISGNLERISEVEASIARITTGAYSGADEHVIDGVALDVDELYETLKQADRAARQLSGTSYGSQNIEPLDVSERLTEASGDRKADSDLSDRTRERLRELETEAS